MRCYKVCRKHGEIYFGYSYNAISYSIDKLAVPIEGWGPIGAFDTPENAENIVRWDHHYNPSVETIKEFYNHHVIFECEGELSKHNHFWNTEHICHGGSLPPGTLYMDSLTPLRILPWKVSK